jgi:diaminohydroxyphosphoribosylaminopyrimidine deaminase / 5-amino-6-(5-phosphoribosylamino)uracil reductase
MLEEKHKRYMGMAIVLAGKAQNPGPNPYVGAILVKNNRIVGKGFHRHTGEPHAEINAISDAGNRAKNAILYVNLEPCVHYGKTPPCTKAIIDAKIKEVIIGMKDPNPLVNGKGIKQLKKAGVRVRKDVLREESKKLNEIYLKFITRKIPFVILKSAASLDGKIAARTGESKWISGEISRMYVHKLRGKVDAILIGINTVLKDDPRLNVHRVSGTAPRPYRVIVDSRLRIPFKARVLNNPKQVILAVTKRAPGIKIKKLQESGFKILVIKEKNGRVDLKILMKELAKMEISSVLIEGGGEVNAGAIESGIVDKILFFIAPKIIGGRNAITSVEGEGIKQINKAIPIKKMTVKMFGKDIWAEGYL